MTRPRLGAVLLLWQLVAVRAVAAAGVEAAFAEGVARFRSGDFVGALPLLQRAHAEDPTDVDCQLLLGITYYRLERFTAAEPLLRAVAATADQDSAAAARIFLALLAQKRGEVDHIRALLNGAGATELDASLRDLVHASQPRRLTALLAVRPEYDSNVPLLPQAPTAQAPGAQQADGDLLVLASLTARPLPRIGLWLDDTASYRQQFTLTAFNFFNNLASAGYTYRGDHDRVSVAYGFETALLGTSLLDIGHHVEVAYRRRLVAELGVGVQYSFTERSYFASTYQPFDGMTHGGAIEFSWGVPEGSGDVRLAAVVVRDELADPAFSALGEGARLGGHWRFARRYELAALGSALYRDFDVAPRRDLQLFADVTVAVDLHRYVSLLVGGSVLRNFSTVASFDYLKLTASLGLVVGWVGP